MRSFDVDFLSMGQAANLYIPECEAGKRQNQTKKLSAFRMY